MEGVGRRLATKSGFLIDIGSNSLNGRERNVLFRNNADETFTDVGWVNRADRVEDGRGLAMLDADHNGAIDLVLRAYRMPAGVLSNRGNSNHWVVFELEGTESNRNAVGARIRLRTGDHWQTRVVSIGSGYLGSNSLRQHFGLGGAERIDEVVIQWPSGQRSTFENLAVDGRYAVREGSPVVSAMDAPSSVVHERGGQLTGSITPSHATP